MKKLTIIVDQNKDGYWGQIQEYPHVFTHGHTITELMDNALDALTLYLEETNQPLVKHPTFEIVLDVQEFFVINDYINITKLAERSGLNSSLLRQYAKGIKFPSLDQVKRIEKTLKEIGAELINTQLVNNVKN